MEELLFSNYIEIANKLKKNHKLAAIIETDTVIGVISLSPSTIYQIKKRPKNKKLVTFVTNINQIDSLSINEKNFLKKFWPGGLTIIKNKISYRIPNHKKLLKIISHTGPIYSSSANISGKSPIKNTQEAIHEFKHYKNFIIVPGKQLSNKPSTIIDLDTNQIIREGAISIKKIMNELKNIKQKIYIGNDHAGYKMKMSIIKLLKNKYNFIDLGSNNEESTDYPIYAKKVCNAVLKNKNNMGILICGTGFGMNIAANKFKGIRATNIINPLMASLAKEHNNCNVITLSARFNTINNNIKIINNFINTTFLGGKHLKRIKMIEENK